MIDDPKIRRLIKKHGAEAYAVYNLVIERIVKRLDTSSPLPDLEEQGEDIADMLKMDTLKVQEVMWSCIEIGLFGQDEMTGRIVAHKIYKFLATSETRSAEIRDMIKAYTDSQKSLIPVNREASWNVTDKSDRIEENRIEQKRREDSKERVSIVPHFSVPADKWAQFTEDYYEADLTDLVERMNDWIDSKHGGRSPYKDYAAALRNWIKKGNLQTRLKEAPETPWERIQRTKE